MPQKKDLAIGGQALIEGVMIRAPKHIAIAVRRPNGSIVVKKEPFISLTKKVKLLGLPIIRGVVNIFETIVIGMRALNYSAEVAFEDEEKPEHEKERKKQSALLATLSMAFSIIFSLALAIFLFKFVPLFLTEQLQKWWPALANSRLLFNLIDGIIRIAIFFLYIFFLSLFKSFRRVFQYHGAEHKAVFVYEKNLPLTVENTRKEAPQHPRCGTSFIIIVLIISIIVLSFVPRHPDFIIHFLRRLSVIPLIAGVAYEILKWSARFQKSAFVKLLTYPGILTQYITTKEPDTGQIEVALKAVEAAVEGDAA